MIAAVGITGTVREIGLFVTSLVTADNVVTYVGNNRLFSENVQNFSANAVSSNRSHRAVAAGGRFRSGEHAPASSACARYRICSRRRLPVIEILSFGLVGTAVAPVLTVRPCCRNEHYAQVYFDTTRAIQEICVHV